MTEQFGQNKRHGAITGWVVLYFSHDVLRFWPVADEEKALEFAAKATSLCGEDSVIYCGHASNLESINGNLWTRKIPPE